MIRTLPDLNRLAHRRRGFTFVEVLFAIIILGIGMIMIAGILPVAIKQQSDTRDDMAAKAVCEAGFAYLSTIVQTNPDAFVPTNFSDTSNQTPQADFSQVASAAGQTISQMMASSQGASTDRFARTVGVVVPLNHSVTTDARLFANGSGPFNAFNKINNSRVLESDPRYQFMAFYRRDEDSATVRLIVVAMKLNNTDAQKAYGYNPVTDRNTMRQEEISGRNGPFLCEEVEIQNQTLEPDRIIFNKGPAQPVLGEGAFVIIASSEASGADTMRPHRNNGRVFQLGQQRLDVDDTGKTWDLTSAYDLDLASSGPDGVDNTADDVVDGSMNRNGSYPVGTTTVAGSYAKAWVIGKGLYDPLTDPGTSNKYSGRVQDIGVLVADVPIR